MHPPRYGMHQGIMRASKINNLLIVLDQGMFGTVRDYCVDSIGWRGLVQGGENWAVYRECTEDWQVN